MNSPDSTAVARLDLVRKVGITAGEASDTTACWVGPTDTAPFDMRSVMPDQLDSVDLTEVGLWVIDGRADSGEQTLRTIRQHGAAAIYLRPVVSLGYDSTHADLTGADTTLGYEGFTPHTEQDLLHKYNRLNLWIDSLPESRQPADRNIAFKMLRLIVSRESELAPQATTQRPTGFAYPLVEPLFEYIDASVQQTLEHLAAQQVLNTRFVTKVHCCSHCQGAFLNFKETCPDCESEDLETDELLHHFRCAYTAELKQFKQDGELICPKCDRKLLHIGVDYDKPSVVYGCRACSHSFNEPDVVTTCFNCQRTTRPEHQTQRSVSAYSATAIGQNAARHGLENLFTSILGDGVELWGYSSFKSLLSVEAARIQRYNVSQSTLMLVNISDLERLYLQLGNRVAEVFVELSAVFQSVLRRSDAITTRNETLFLVLLTETDPIQAGRAVQRLKEGIAELLASNLDHEPEIIADLEAVDETVDLDESVERFLSQHVA